ncbi:MAG: thioredoxin family protein [Bacteroidales bacterium]|nr:thioredoxin family protein [Bacteroidales bacterium]
MNDTTSTGMMVREILIKEPAVMLYFYNDHCAPCISLRPKVEYLLEQEFPMLKLVLVNGESEAMTSAAFGVFSHPTLIIFFEGKEYIRESKYVSIGQLDRAIRRPYDLLFKDQSL